MEIKGKVHCFFEQSGTFKNEFIKLGIPAEDYDIQDNFGETDHVIDLFAEIEKGYDGKPSIFDNIGKDDLIVAFFPCIYFCGLSQVMFSWTAKNNLGVHGKERMDKIIERNANRSRFFELLLKMIGVCVERNVRIVFENPYSEQTHLKEAFLKKPDIIDNDRTKRGDFYPKTTAYWFFNCEPTKGFTQQQTPKNKVKGIVNAKSASKAGLCSEERSLISPDYARNFICDFILGKSQPNICKTLFD